MLIFDVLFFQKIFEVKLVKKYIYLQVTFRNNLVHWPIFVAELAKFEFQFFYDSIHYYGGDEALHAIPFINAHSAFSYSQKCLPKQHSTYSILIFYSLESF